jgi:hypothetical protein
LESTLKSRKIKAAAHKLTRARCGNFFMKYSSPLGNNSPIDMLFSVVKLSNMDNYIIAQQKIRVVMGIGIQAKAEGPILQGAEHASGIFSCDNSLSAAAYRMAAFRSVKRVGSSFPD